jgi:threonine synthase
MGKPSVELFVLYPEGKISEFQQKQMTTVKASNVHVISVEGGTSDSLDLVLKGIASDKKFCADFKVSYINSFNWGRILIQAAHYFFSYFQVDAEVKGKVSFAIPTGAMGNLAAGYLAFLMGLPLEKLIVATNSNDILNRFFQDGDFSKKDVKQTVSPSMDIQAPYIQSGRVRRRKKEILY